MSAYCRGAGVLMPGNIAREGIEKLLPQQSLHEKGGQIVLLICGSGYTNCLELYLSMEQRECCSTKFF